jgi:dTDP-4-amino-4,6-dideoxygalactose transaminase
LLREQHTIAGPIPDNFEFQAMNEPSAQPFLPFTRPTIDEATIADVSAVLRSGWLTSNGPKVQAFESTLSKYFSGRPVRSFNSGTCTMEIALRIAGIGPGDEVITTPNSWVATANVIIEVGATPVFADIDPRSHNIDVDQITAAITPRTRAIIPVHMCGLPCDMDKLYALAAKHSLRVVEDAAQAIGSTWKGKRIGAFGDLVSFSFQVNKNIMTAEGGCLVVNTAQEAELAERYRLQGVSRHGLDGIDVDVLGGKYNMTEISAAIGLAQMRQLDTFNAQRLALAKHYFSCFGTDFESKYGAELPVADFEQSNWHMFHLVLPERMARAPFMQRMLDVKIGLGFHYAAIHLFTLYRKRGFKEGMFPVAERVCRQIVTLPLFPSMNNADVERVVGAVKSILDT